MNLEQFQCENDLQKLHPITPKNRDFKMLVAPRYLDHYFQNVYEEFTVDLLLNLSKDGMLFIDIGAHYGFYSVLVGARHPKSRIIAFEPALASYEILKKNLTLNQLNNVDAYNLALSDREEIKQFNVAEVSDSSGFYEHPLSRTVKTIEIKTLALDKFFKDIPKGPVIIKIDTGGHEIHVLEGMKNILRDIEDVKIIIKFNPKMLRIAGFQPEHLLKELSRFGFDVFFINDQQRETYKLGENDFNNWSKYVNEESYINILCVRRKRSLSVCLFSHSSQLAGAERSLLELVTELIREYGAICSVVLPNDGPLGKKLEQVGASTWVIHYDWWCDPCVLRDEEITDRLYKNFNTTIGEIKEKVKRINPDVIFTNTVVIPWGAIIALLLNKPHVWFVHEFGRLDHELKFYLPFEKVLRIIRESSNVVLTNSEAVRTSLFGRGSGRNILTVSYYIDIPPNAIPQDRKEFFNRKGATRLVIAGTVSQSKGQEDAILAVRELVNRKKNVELIIVGYADSRYLKELRNLVEDEKLEEYVRFVDFQENVYPLIREADIVLVCSRNEAFGRVTVEAMLLKKPVIGTKSGGTKEIIKEEFNGFLYEPGDHEELSEKIEFLIENRSKMRELGENGFKFVKENFTKEKYGGQICGVLKGLKNERNPASLAPGQFIMEQVAETLSSSNREVAEKKTLIADIETLLKQRDAEIGNLKETITTKDVYISHLEGTISEREGIIGSLQEAINQKAIQIYQLEGVVRERETVLDRLKMDLAEKGREIRSLNEAVTHRNGQISHLEATVNEKDGEIGNLQEGINQKATQISHLEGAVSAKDGEIKVLRETTGQRNAQISRLESLSWEKEAMLNHIYNSHGWKALLIYYKLRDKILPVNSRRRRFAKIIFNAVKNPKGLINLNKTKLKKICYFMTFKTIDPTLVEEEIKGTAGTDAFFTICSKNFLAHARVLYNSVRPLYPNARLFVVLCDRVDGMFDPTREPFEFVYLEDLGLPNLNTMAESYNITEFNTAVKPFAFNHLMEKHRFGSVIYLDPDILLVDRMHEIDRMLAAGAEAVLTPHILQPAEHDEVHDGKMLLYGIYNLGFLALRNTPSVRAYLSWWGRRLERDCVIRLDQGLFVDQKWVDLLPAFVPGARVIHHPGYNVAYWNLPQRRITQLGEQWFANGHPLRFVHFSGIEIEDKGVFSRHSQQVTMENIEDLRRLVEYYREQVLKEGHEFYRGLPYAYSWDGEAGMNLHAPKPVYQLDKRESAPGATAVHAFSVANAAPLTVAKPAVELGAAMSSRPSSVQEPNWISMMLAARSISGGWLQMSKKAVKALRTGGVSELRQRIDRNRAKVIGRQMRTEEHMGAAINDGFFIKLQRETTLPIGLVAKAIPKVFVTDWSTPRPDQDAGSVTAFFLLKILVELGYDVTFVPSDLQCRGGYTNAIRRLGVRCLHTEDIGTVKEHLKERGSDYSAFILIRAPIAGLYLADIRKHAPWAKVILETADLHYLRDERSALIIGTEEAIAAAQTEKDSELDIISGCDVTIVLSPLEKEVLSQELPRADIRTMPLLFLDKLELSDCSFEQRKDILFIGCFRHPPNVDAVIWFSQDVWPLVRQHLPEARFLIIGSDSTPEVLALGEIPGVVVLGHVKNLDSTFSSVRLSVAPLRYGAGIKGKVGTSLGYGVPVVGTQVAFEGMELENGMHVMIADDVNAFADSVVRTYSDSGLWNRLSLAGFERVHELYSERAGRMRLKGLMGSLNLKSTDFEFYRFRSHEEYRIHKHRAADEYQRREQVELSLIRHDANCFYVDGYCAVCRDVTKFRVGFTYPYQNTADGKPIPDWREHLNCVKCGFTNRVRLVLHLLQDVVRPQANARIYVTEQNTPVFKWLQSRYPQIMGSEYLGDSLPWGAYCHGLRNENLIRLSFADKSFDLILSFDVMEHAIDDLSALSECFRCLAPGGTLVFTAPCNLESASNVVRAQMRSDGTIEHLMSPPEYHVNPADPENGALCFRYFGWEVIGQLKSVGFHDAQVISAWSRDLAYLGGEQIVFVATKGTV